MVSKALGDTTLRTALRYFNEEVVDDNRPLYGIYKAIEVIAHHLGNDGWKQLAALAGKNKKAYPVVPGASCNGSCGRFEGP